MQALHLQLLKDPSSVQVVTKTFISLPTADAHKGHQSGPGMACYTRRIHPTVVNKIGEIVAEGITDVQTVKHMFRHYILHDLCKDQPPNPEDRAYFPFEDDIQNHVQIVKRPLQLSCLDQENVQLKIEQWKSLYPDDTHFFRPYIQKEASESIATSSDVTPIKREREIKVHSLAMMEQEMRIQAQAFPITVNSHCSGCTKHSGNSNY